MTRQSFLTFSSVVAVGVAVFALCFPSSLLAGKGVEPERALLVWVREVGALILASGVTTFLVRKAPDSVALRGVLIGNALLHVGLLPIEVLAFSAGVITKLSGVAPNSLLHALLAVGFVTYARSVRVSPPRCRAAATER
jgi:hypothetical protein